MDNNTSYPTIIDEVTNKPEMELAKVKVPLFKTIEELTEFIEALAHREHDYGTCVYAMSLAAEEAFNYIAHVLGVTGFQAGAAELSFLKSSRRMEDGFMILDYNKLLYPQYVKEFPTYDGLIEEQKEHLAEKARELLKDASLAHPNVKQHWMWLSSLYDSSPTTKTEET